MDSKWDNSYCNRDEVISSIEGSEKLLSLYGSWPTFTDAEIVEINLSRGNFLEHMRRKDWEGYLGVALDIKIFVFNEMFSENDCKRNPAIVSIRFNKIQDICLEGFNYQNPICALGIHKEYSEDLKMNMFRVSWGGAALQHDVCLTCEEIIVGEVQINGVGGIKK